MTNGPADPSFQVAVSVDNAAGLSITPVMWSDNYVELTPGESVTLTACQNRSSVVAAVAALR